MKPMDGTKTHAQPKSAFKGGEPVIRSSAQSNFAEWVIGVHQLACLFLLSCSVSSCPPRNAGAGYDGWIMDDDTTKRFWGYNNKGKVSHLADS